MKDTIATLKYTHTYFWKIANPSDRKRNKANEATHVKYTILRHVNRFEWIQCAVRLAKDGLYTIQQANEKYVSISTLIANVILLTYIFRRRFLMNPIAAMPPPPPPSSSSLHSGQVNNGEKNAVAQ